MDIKHHHFHPEAHFFYENATGMGDVINIWQEGIHESKKGKSKIAVNSPWLLDYHEICFKNTYGPIKAKYFYIRCN